jgi:hypothetical protein
MLQEPEKLDSFVKRVTVYDKHSELYRPNTMGVSNKGHKSTTKIDSTTEGPLLQIL